MDDKTLVTIDRITDIVFLSLMLLQQITNKNQEEVMEMIRAEAQKRTVFWKSLGRKGNQNEG